MILHAYEYSSLRELNSFLKEVNNIEDNDFRILTLKHSESKKGKIKFNNINHKRTQNRMLKKFLILTILIVVSLFTFFKIIDDFNPGGFIASALDGIILGGIILIFVWLFKLIFSSKTVVFEKNKFYSPMMIGSHYYNFFDEIKIKNAEHIDYAIFYKNGKPPKHSIILISDNKTRLENMIAFCKDYCIKADKTFSIELD